MNSVEKFYKILRADLTHHGFVYKLGLNVDTVRFRPYGAWLPGGLYYTNLTYLSTYLDHGSLLAEVRPVGRIYADPSGTVWKTDKLFIDSITPKKEWLTYERKISMAKLNGKALRYFAEPTYELQLAAVRQNGCAIQYVLFPTEEMQLIAVNQNFNAIQHIVNPSETVKLAAIRHDERSIDYIENPTEEMQLAAVEQDGRSLQYIENPTENVKRIAAATKGKSGRKYMYDMTYEDHLRVSYDRID